VLVTRVGSITVGDSSIGSLDRQSSVFGITHTIRDVLANSYGLAVIAHDGSSDVFASRILDGLRHDN
jgi:hypothetical protein